MSGLNIIGIDLAKTNFYLFSLSPEGKSTGRIKLSRDKLIGWFATQPRMVVAMEACGASGVSLDIENYCTIRASPACQRQRLRFLSALQLKIKGRDCGTINGHNESLTIRTLMKDAREALVR
jgi:hypothetical protein